MSRTQSVISVLVLAALLGGCASGKPPVLTAPRAAVAERTPEGLAVVVFVDAENPNAEAIPLRRVRYSVKVDGKSTFEGEREAETTLRGFGRQQVELPATFPGLSEASTFEVSAEMEWMPPSTIRETLHDAGLSYPSASLAASGTVSQETPPKPDRMLSAPGRRLPTRR